MRKIRLLIILTASFFSNLTGQDNGVDSIDYHLIYIELSNNNNRLGLTDELTKMYDSIVHSNDNIVCFISNAENGFFFKGAEKLKELFFLIHDLNISIPNAELDLRAITNYWNTNDISYLDENGLTVLSYENLFIHYFISPSFYDISGNHISTKLLCVNNFNIINKNTANVHQLYYFNHNDIDQGYLDYLEAQQLTQIGNQIARQFTTY